MKTRPRIGILSLGCPRNVVDSESILGRLNLKGYPITDMHQADIAIINTCAFIDDAKKESIEAILDVVELKNRGEIKKIIIYGCLSQRYGEKLIKEIPQIDALAGRISLNHDLNLYSITPGYYAYLKICEGCINNCSYCVIPKIKGRFASLGIESILERIDALNARRISELNIIGQDITGYGIDLYQAPQLAMLLKKLLSRAKNIRWVRLLYLYPSRITDELIDLIAHEPNLCKYIDLPLQHINDRILKLMRRNMTKKDILRLIDKIRKRIPGVAIRTSLIVGFPSETEREFKELLRIIEDIRFERLGAFIYSREPETYAAGLKGQIPSRLKAARLHQVMLVQQGICRKINQEFLGQTIEVLIEEKEKDFYLGRSQHDAPEVDGIVYVSSKKGLKPGDFVKVKINDALEYDLVGEAV